jgi:hypothetical protein
LLEAGLRLLRSGRVGMAVLLLEQSLALQRERERRVEQPPPRTCNAEGRA